MSTTKRLPKCPVCWEIETFESGLGGQWNRTCNNDCDREDMNPETKFCSECGGEMTTDDNGYGLSWECDNDDCNCNEIFWKIYNFDRYEAVKEVSWKVSERAADRLISEMKSGVLAYE